MAALQPEPASDQQLQQAADAESAIEANRPEDMSEHTASFRVQLQQIQPLYVQPARFASVVFYRELCGTAVLTGSNQCQSALPPITAC